MTVTNRESFVSAAADLGVTVSPKQAEQLEQYLDYLLEINEVVNLTAIRDKDVAWERHLLDSMPYIPLIPEKCDLLDIGSGGGIPAIPIAIMRPESTVTCLEATGKKCHFLTCAAEEVGLTNLKVVPGRCEDLGKQGRHRGNYDIVTARAVAELRVLVEYAMPFLKIEGRLLSAKGSKVRGEIKDAARAFRKMRCGKVKQHRGFKGLPDDACMVEISLEGRIPNDMPRANGIPAQKPL